MIKAILIDDERNSIEMLEWLIQNHCPDIKIVATCDSGEKGIEAIREWKPDVIFLDIQMPKMNGFDMLERIRDIDFEIVFHTAYDQFAVKAFKYAALNYLLKPVDPDDLIDTVNRLKHKLSAPSKEQMELLFQHLMHRENPAGRIALSTGDGLIFVQTKDITYCKAESNYTHVVMANSQKILVAKTLKEIDDTLSGKDFFRAHHSYLVNINHISRFVRGDGGYILMPDNTQITIARSKRDEFFQLFAKF